MFRFHIPTVVYLFVFFKLNSGILKQIDGVFCVHVLRQVELEVELPGGGPTLRDFALFIQESEAQLNNLEKVYIATQKLVLVVSCGLELA